MMLVLWIVYANVTYATLIINVWESDYGYDVNFMDCYVST
jgi:hypothetical protein